MKAWAVPQEPTAHFEAASTIAVVASSNEPLLFLNADQTLIAASTSFCRTFQIDPGTVPGRRLSQLGQGSGACPRWLRFSRLWRQEAPALMPMKWTLCGQDKAHGAS